MSLEGKVVLTGVRGYPLSWQVSQYKGEYVNRDALGSGQFVEIFDSYELCRRFVLRELKEHRDVLGREMEKWSRRDHLKTQEENTRGEIWC